MDGVFAYYPSLKLTNKVNGSNKKVDWATNNMHILDNSLWKTGQVLKSFERQDEKCLVEKMISKMILNGKMRSSSPLMGSGLKSGFPEQRRCFCVNSASLRRIQFYLEPVASLRRIQFYLRPEPVASLRRIQFYLRPVCMHVFARWPQPPFYCETNLCFRRKKPSLKHLFFVVRFKGWVG